jgi:hypothetical protein
VNIESSKNTDRVEERLLESIDALAERVKDIVRITSPIVQEILVVIRSAESAFGQGDGSTTTGASTSTEYRRSGETWTGNGKLTTVVGIGAAWCALAYLMWSRR